MPRDRIPTEVEWRVREMRVTDVGIASVPSDS